MTRIWHWSWRTKSRRCSFFLWSLNIHSRCRNSFARDSERPALVELCILARFAVRTWAGLSMPAISRSIACRHSLSALEPISIRQNRPRAMLHRGMTKEIKTYLADSLCRMA